MAREKAFLIDGRQAAVNQQIGGFDKGQFFSHLGDVKAAIAQDALVAVNVGDGTGAGTRILITVIKGYAAGLCMQIGDVDRALLLGSRDQREFILVAVDDDFCCLP